MRSEFMVGSVLIIAGALTSGIPIGDDLLVGPGVEGDALFMAANYTGNAEVHASHAMGSVEGPAKAEISATRATVTLHEYTRYGGWVVLKYGLEIIKMPDATTVTTAFDGASLQFSGLDDGLLHVWPTTDNGSRFNLTLSETDAGQIFPSKRGATLFSDSGAHWYNIPGPTYGLMSGEYTFQGYSQGVELAPSSFDQLNAEGPLEIILGNGDLTVSHTGGEQRYELRTDPGIEGEVDPVGPAEAGYFAGTKVTYAVVTFERGNLRLGFDDVGAIFVTSEPTWQVDGSVEFDAHEGQITYDNTSHSLNDTKTKLIGNTTMKLHPEGMDEGSPDELRGIGFPNELLPPPESEAGISGEPEQVSLDGKNLVMTPGVAHTSPPEISTLGKLLGILLIAWAAIGKVIPFVVRLIVRDPLKHTSRKRIYKHIQEARIAHVRDLSRKTGIPSGSLVYHLRILRNARLVTTIRRNGYTVYFLTTDCYSRDELHRLALLVEPTRQGISRMLTETEAATQKELADRIGVSISSISRQLNNLAEAGLVERSGSWGSQYRASSLLMRWMSQPEKQNPSNPSNLSPQPDGTAA